MSGTPEWATGHVAGALCERFGYHITPLRDCERTTLVSDANECAQAVTKLYGI